MRLGQAGEGYSADDLTTQGETEAHAKQARKMPRAATRAMCSSHWGSVPGRSRVRVQLRPVEDAAVETGQGDPCGMASDPANWLQCLLASPADERSSAPAQGLTLGLGREHRT